MFSSSSKYSLDSQPAISTDFSMSQMRLVAFNITRWKPTREEWILANRLIQREESYRINQFVFQRDAKSSMASRLLLRKVIKDSLCIPNTKANLIRDSNGRPVLESPPNMEFDFNASHQGDFSVVASGPYRQIGIDVMKIKYTGGRPIPEFFRLMRRQFTPDEWKYIEEPSSESEKVARFYRTWTLKESYVKAIGIGLGMDLQRINFKICDELRDSCVLRSTVLEVDKERKADWIFHEMMLDDVHCVATATLGANSANLGSYAQLEFTGLVEELEARDEVNSSELEHLWQTYQKRDEYPI